MEPRGPARRDNGYRADARLHQANRHRTPGIVVVLAAIVVAGIAFAALDMERPSPSPTSLEAAASDGSEPTAGSTAEPTPAPVVEILGQPAPTRPVPLHVPWLRWLDPASADLGGDVVPPNVTTPLDIVDAGGQAVQVCPASGEPDQSYIPQGLDLCSFDAGGAGTGRVPLMAFGRFDPAGLTTEVPVEYDATVSRDGQWLWVVVAYPHPANWVVDAVRVDLSTRTVAGRQRLRTLPIGVPGSATPSPEGWLVPSGAGIWPVVRASPSGRLLSVAVVAGSGSADWPSSVTGMERLVLDATLNQSPVTVASGFGAPTDTACDPERGAWATEDHYLTICQHGEAGGAIQPFVRIEQLGEMTRDVTVGPALPAPKGNVDSSSWLLDSQAGTLYRWASSDSALSRLNVRTRDGSTVLLTDAVPRPGPVAQPPGGASGDGSIAWTPIGKVGLGKDGLQLAGTADGQALFALGVLPGGYGDIDASRQAVVWVVDSANLRLVAQWNAPGPVDQIAVGPGGGPLVELVTPILTNNGSLAGPASDWTTRLWLVDERSGKPLELMGQLHGPGKVAPALLSPVVGMLAGF